MRQTIASKTPRIEVVDALRGFAVMAILLVHNLEHFIFPVYPDAASQPGWLNILDEGVFSVTFSLFAGKAYAIFALLFGLTFYIQYTNQLKKGKDFGYRFLWRLLLLGGFATLNAAFFPAGDVLLLFCVVGIFLFIVRKWSDRTVFILAIFLLLQPVEWYHYVMNLFNPAHSLPDLGVGQMYGEVAEYTKEGDFWKFIWGNVTLGQKASLFWAIGAGRFLQTAGLFLLGMLIGRKQLFVASEATIRFLGESPDLECRSVWSSLSVESAIDGCRTAGYDTPDGRGSDGYVAKVCFHNSIGRFVRAAISNGEIQEADSRFAVLW